MNVMDRDRNVVEESRRTDVPAAGEAATPERLPDLVCELLFNQLQQISVVSLAAAGGVLTLLGTAFVDVVEKRSAFIAIAAFGLAAFMALYGQNHLVDALVARRHFLKRLRAYKLIAYAFLGAGIGAFLGFVLDLS